MHHLISVGRRAPSTLTCRRTPVRTQARLHTGSRGGAPGISRRSRRWCPSSTTSCGRSPADSSAGSHRTTRCRRRRSCTKPTCACCASITSGINWIARACWPWPASRCAASSSTHAQSRTRQKRGGDARPVSLEWGDEPALLDDVQAEEVLAIDVALESVGGAGQSRPPRRRVPRVRGPDAAGDRRRARHLTDRSSASARGRRRGRGCARKSVRRTRPLPPAPVAITNRAGTHNRQLVSAPARRPT